MMDDIAEGAHQGMTVQMEHTQDWDPVMDDAANSTAHHVLSSFQRVSNNYINMYLDFSLMYYNSCFLLYPIDCMATFLGKSLNHMQFQ